MKKNLFIFFILSVNFLLGYAQSNNDNCDKLPIGHVRDGKAQHRENRYRTKKKEGLKEFSGKDDIDSVQFTKDIFEQLLKNLTANPNYDGYRIYFATYPSETNKNSSQIDSGYAYVYKELYDKFAFIFVPTFRDSKDTTIHNDDINNYWIVYTDAAGTDRLKSYKRSNETFLSKWIYKYRVERCPYFNADGNGFVNKGVSGLYHKRKNFKETFTMWYSRDKATSILEYIGNNSCRRVDFVSIYMTAYLLKHKSWSYQLTPVFGILYKPLNDLNGVPKKIFISYSGDDKSKANGSQGTDTGVPCPPPPVQGGNCPGSLPQ